MASARNRVIAGEYDGMAVKYAHSQVVIPRVPYSTTLELNAYNQLRLGKANVKQYEVITEETMKSGSSAILRGALGASVLGPLGLLAGLSAKNKGIYTIAIEWKDGNKSLIEIDEKIYKELIRDLF